MEADARPWHALSVDQCLEAIGSRPEGLTQVEVRERVRRFGSNELPRAPRPGWLQLFVRQFHSPLIYLLLAAALVSLVVGENTDAGFIIVVLIINALIGTIQESRAENAMESLQQLIRQDVLVRRDGSAIRTDARDLVPGDVVQFETGMAVPADVRLLTAKGLLADESTFTGESLPVTKNSEVVVAAEAVLADRSNMLHAATTVVEGRATGVVVATATATALGGIERSLLRSTAALPPLVLRLRMLAHQIAIGALVLIGLLSGLLVLQGVAASHILFLAVALAVSAVPEGLPIAVTVALAAASRRMAERHVIVRSLPAVEGLGACTLIASDKTGTLTLNRLTLERLLLATGALIERPQWQSGSADHLERSARFENRAHHSDTLSPHRSFAKPVPTFASAALVSELAAAAAACNDAVIEGEAIHGDAVDVALLSFAAEAGVDVRDSRRPERLASMPYEPVKKFAAVAIPSGSRAALVVKGAPETVLPMCVHPGAEGSAGAERLAAAGYRILAIAKKDIERPVHLDESMLQGLRLLGFVALLDPLRPEVPAAIARCADAGISVRMVTGDHPATALTIARQLGLGASMAEVVTGSELAQLADRPLERDQRIRSAKIFARIEPEQKLLIVEVLARGGDIVAVTGDGVNDAPALQAAHIGVAMGKGGTDVARSASDLVLTDDNFASIVAGVEEGRITYGNIRKIIIFLLATGIAEIFMFLGSVIVGLPMPLTPVQLIWANLVTNGAQDVMLGFGKGEGDELRHPPRRPREPLLDPSAVALMVPPAAAMTVMALMLMDRALDQGADLASAQNLVLLLVVLFQNAFVLAMRSERRPLLRQPIGTNPWLLIGVAGALALHITAMQWSPLAKLLGTGPVTSTEAWLCIAGALVILIITELTKLAITKRMGRGT